MNNVHYFSVPSKLLLMFFLEDGPCSCQGAGLPSSPQAIAAGVGAP